MNLWTYKNRRQGVLVPAYTTITFPRSQYCRSGTTLPHTITPDRVPAIPNVDNILRSLDIWLTIGGRF